MRGMRGGERRRQVVAALTARDGDRCYYCQSRFRDDVPGLNCTVDHVVALSRGGTNAMSNLRLACAHCNARKAALGSAAYEVSEGLACRRRVALRDEMLDLGYWLPKHYFHHRDLVWSGEMQWTCHACGQAYIDGRRSPATVPCMRVEELGDSARARLLVDGEWRTDVREPYVQRDHARPMLEELVSLRP